MLYSLNGAYPTQLPFRIVLSNGATRTDPTSFLQEEISDAGYVLAPDIPETGPYQKLLWNGTSWYIEETRTLEVAITIKLNELSSIRQTKETNFVFNGTEIYLDQLTQARINGAVTGFAYRPDEIISWEVTRGNFMDFDKTTMEALGVAAWEHVKRCYEIVKAITEQIKACTTLQEIDNINLADKWENQSANII